MLESETNKSSNDRGDDVEVADHKFVKKMSSMKKIERNTNNTEIIVMKDAKDTISDESWKKTNEMVNAFKSKRKKCFDL
jgi:hypothetical protein